MYGGSFYEIVDFITIYIVKILTEPAANVYIGKKIMLNLVSGNCRHT